MVSTLNDLEQSRNEDEELSVVVSMKRRGFERSTSSITKKTIQQRRVILTVAVETNLSSVTLFKSWH